MNDLLCLSHLRWAFVFERPQYLMARFARTRRVFFIEEPIFDAAKARLTIRSENGVQVVVAHLPEAFDPAEARLTQRRLIRRLIQDRCVEPPTLWFYTPLAQDVVHGLPSSVVAYDCVEDLSRIAGAPGEMKEAERELLSRADVVFTGGRSLDEARKSLHPNIHAFPSNMSWDATFDGMSVLLREAEAARIAH